MRFVLLIDFGSTYTKLTAVDVEKAEVLATADDYTTADTDIMIGFEKAYSKLQSAAGNIAYQKRLACSSAAGGLRMVACGLVPALTAKAAKLAAFGAGAKVIQTFAYELTNDDVAQIDAIAPDILLLTGGTDGGNREVIEHNAHMLARSKRAFPIVYAGNRGSKDVCTEQLDGELHPVYATENVMPVLNKLNILPAQSIIRQIFLEKIISGKGLSREKALIEGIIMPTPSAVLSALTLLSEGTNGRRGIGELMAVDLGGATTDIYSIAKGAPSNPATILHGLQEPYAKRTVEGDIGMRYSAHGIVEAAGMDETCRCSGLDSSAVNAMLDRINRDKSMLPQTEEEKAFDFALAALAVRIGLCRHAGTIQQIYTPMGPVFQQTGKDLTEIDRIIITGGALIHSAQYTDIIREAVSVSDEQALIPRKARVARDARYILSAMGLLASYDQNTAFDILYKSFGKDEVYATE